MQHEFNKQSNVQQASKQASKQARNKRRGDAPLSDYDDYGASSETGILSSLSTGHSLNTEESPIADPLRVLSGNETPDSTGGLVHGVSHVGMQDEDDEQGEFASSGDDAFQDDEAIEDVDGEVVYLEEPPCPSSEALALTSGVRYADADCSKMVFQGYSGAVKVYTAVDLLSSLATHLKTHGYHDASRAVKELGHQTKDLADWKSLRMVQATDLFDLKFTKIPSKKTLKDAGFKMKKAFERDFRSGLTGLRQNEVQMFLHDHCVKNLMKYEDWVSMKHTVAHLNFKKEYARDFSKITSVGAKTAIKRYTKHLKRCESESFKSAFFLGKAVDALRTKHLASWQEICDKGEFELGERTLRTYQNFFRFVAKYPLFFRVSISYTSIAKYSKRLNTYFESHDEEASMWSDLDYGKEE